MAGPIPQIEGVDVHPLGVQYMISTGVPKDTETTGDRLERLWPVLLSAEQQTDQVVVK
jgi:hypothetical protein